MLRFFNCGDYMNTGSKFVAYIIQECPAECNTGESARRRSGGRCRQTI